MPLTSDQAFKVGFLLRCAEEGLSNDETHRRVKLAFEKRAILPQLAAGAAGLAGGVASAGGKLISLGGKVMPLAAGLALLAPILGGGAIGYLSAKSTEGGPDLVERAKHEEIIGEYERLADEAKRKARAKRLARGYPAVNVPT